MVEINLQEVGNEEVRCESCQIEVETVKIDVMWLIFILRTGSEDIVFLTRSPR